MSSNIAIDSYDLWIVLGISTRFHLSYTESKDKQGGSSEKDSGPKIEDKSEEDEEAHNEDDKNNGPERSEYDRSEPAENEEKESESKESNKNKRKKKQGRAKSYAKKGTAENIKTKKVTISKEASPPPKKEPPKSPSSLPKNKKDTSTKRSSGKKKDESIQEKKSTSKKASTSVSPGEKLLRVRDNLEEERLKASDDELKNVICENLKEVDFNTDTFTDILKLLAKRFNKDLMSRKQSIKLMIHDELTKLADTENVSIPDNLAETGCTLHTNLLPCFPFKLCDAAAF